MEFKFNLDLQAIVDAATAPDRINPLIDKAITEALKHALDEATGYRSEFRKTLTTQMVEALPHGLGVDDTARFQHLLNIAMSNVIGGLNNDAIKAAIDKVVRSVSPDVPSTVKVSELLDDARHGFLKEDHEAFYAHLEMSSYGGGGRLYLDKDEDTSRKYSAAVRLSFNGEGEVYAVKLDGVDITPSTAPSVVGKFEGVLMALYVGRSRLELDIDSDDVEAAAQSKHDY